MTDHAKDATRNDTQTGSEEAVQAVMRDFESYAGDLTTRLAHGARAGTAGERVRDEANRLIEDYRARIDKASDLAEAQKWLSAFKREAQRLRP
jgi:hypothetical protein